MVNTIDARMLAKMFLAGAKNLEVKKEWINELNVFPVPDGDTGTNMTLTIMSAVKEVNGMESLSMENLAKAISSGSLRGAGDSMTPMFIMLYSYVLFRQIYLFVITQFINTPVVVGFGYPLGWMMCSLLTALFYFFGGWEKRIH